MTTPDVAAGEGSRAEDEVEDGGQGESFLGGLEHFLHILPAMITLGVIVVIVLTVVQVFHSPLFKQLGDALGDLVSALATLLNSPFFYPLLITYLLLPVLGPVLVSLISARNRSRFVGSDENDAQVSNAEDRRENMLEIWAMWTYSRGRRKRAAEYSDADRKQGTNPFLEHVNRILEEQKTDTSDSAKQFVDFFVGLDGLDDAYGASLIDAVARPFRKSKMSNGSLEDLSYARLIQLYVNSQSKEVTNIDSEKFRDWLQDPAARFNALDTLMARSGFSKDARSKIVSDAKKGKTSLSSLKNAKDRLKDLHQNSFKAFDGSGDAYFKASPAIIMAMRSKTASEIIDRLPQTNRFAAPIGGEFWSLQAIKETNKNAPNFALDPNRKCYRMITINKKLFKIPFTDGGEVDIATFTKLLRERFEDETQATIDGWIESIFKGGKILEGSAMETAVNRIAEKQLADEVETHTDLFSDDLITDSTPEGTPGYTHRERARALEILDETFKRARWFIDNTNKSLFDSEGPTTEAPYWTKTLAEHIYGKNTANHKYKRQPGEIDTFKELLAQDTLSLQELASKCPNTFRAAIGYADSDDPPNANPLKMYVDPTNPQKPTGQFAAEAIMRKSGDQVRLRKTDAGVIKTVKRTVEADGKANEIYGKYAQCTTALNEYGAEELRHVNMVSKLREGKLTTGNVAMNKKWNTPNTELEKAWKKLRTKGDENWIKETKTIRDRLKKTVESIV